MKFTSEQELLYSHPRKNCYILTLLGLLYFLEILHSRISQCKRSLLFYFIITTLERKNVLYLYNFELFSSFSSIFFEDNPQYEFIRLILIVLLILKSIHITSCAIVCIIML